MKIIDNSSNHTPSLAVEREGSSSSPRGGLGRRLIVIGITDAPHPFFPPEVLDIIRQGRVFSGGKRHHQLVASLLPEGSEWIDITAPLDAVFAQYEHIFSACPASASSSSLVRSDSTAAPSPAIIVFASGDPLFFGFANTLRQRLPEARLTVFPSFNSLQMLAHRLLMPYHDMRVVSLTGRPWPEFDKALIEQTPKIGILTDRQHTPQAIAQRMMDYGYLGYQMTVGEHLGNPEQERVQTLSLDEAAAMSFQQPNCIILQLTDAQKLPPSIFGIPDSEFEHLDGRERMITKMPIRLLSLQAMQLHRRSVLWDIGFCTGSVSIEAKRLFPHLSIEAFEIREQGRRLIEVNTRRFGTPGINVHICDFLEADISTLPIPDAVFIGGHGGQLAAIMEKVAAVMPNDACMVMNSVTPQSKQVFCETSVRLGLRLLPANRVVLNDYNPIEILTALQS